MRYFVHIFLGQPFENIVPQIGREILRFGAGEVADHIGCFVAQCSEDQVTFKKLSVTSNGKIPELPCRAEDLQIEWVDEQQVPRTELAAYWSTRIFDPVLHAGVDYEVPVLNAVLHFPFYKREAFDELSLIYDAIVASTRPTVVDFTGYCDDMASLLEPDYRIDSPAARQVPLLKEFRQKYHFGMDTHFVVIENRSSAGLALNLTQDTLACMLAWFAIATASNYNEIFPSTVEYRDVVSFGVSVLYVDKYLYVDYLLQRTLLQSMDHAQVNKRDVHVDEIGKVATSLLKDHQHILSQCFEALVKASGSDRYEILMTMPGFPEEEKQLMERCRSVVDHEEYGVTEKAAILAMLLARTECSLFAQAIFNTDNVTIDDLYREPIDHLIQADQAEFFQVDGEAPQNPIDELKRVKTREINSEASVRRLTEILANLESQISDADDSDKVLIEDGFYTFRGQKFRLLPDVEEDPLEETYVAHDPRAESVDLRKNFNAIRNQGQQGSCLAHAVTSIFEYILNSGTSDRYDLSEAFLYYNARLLDQEVYPNEEVTVYTDIGSRYKPAMLSLQRYGIAKEELCPYDENIYTYKPSPSAYEDAATRKLKKALNVNRTVREIKSALEDGYPVAISLNILEDFGRDPHGFISMPDEKVIARMGQSEESSFRHARHALVITGYSDTLKRFVVRNSWGVAWGDRGYCYIPYEYIAHEKLCNFACIIQEVEFTNAPRMSVIPTLEIDTSDIVIRCQITKDALREEIRNREQYRNRRLALFEYFNRLQVMYSSDANMLGDFNRANVDKRRKDIEDRRRMIAAEEEAIETGCRAFNRYQWIWTLTTLGSVLSVIVFFWFAFRISGSFALRWCLPILFVEGCGAAIHYVWTWRRWREERADRTYAIKRLEKNISGIEKDIAEFKYKSFAAFNLIRILNSVQEYLQQNYNHLISLINNLHTWYAEIEDLNKQIVFKAGLPIEQLLDRQALDDYFARNMQQDRVCRVNFCEGLEQYETSEDYLIAYKKDLMNTISRQLAAYPVLRSFNIAAHALGTPESEIARPITQGLLKQCLKQADVALFIRSEKRAIIDYTDYLLAPTIVERRRALAQAFHLQGDFLQIDNPYCMTLLRVGSFDYEECVALHE